MVEDRARRILLKLKETFTMPKWAASNRDPFETLIVTMISQNTTDRNTARAFGKLSNRFKIVPEAFVGTELAEIEECLRVAGLYRHKAKTIKQVSEITLHQFHGDFGQIMSLPLDEARRTLLQFPGVGPKTADVVLLFCAEKPTIPVDTHVCRVSKRLGLAPDNGKYEAVRTSLQKSFNQEDYAAVHMLLILHGREYCKARTPLCGNCPVNSLCPSRYKWDNCDRAR